MQLNYPPNCALAAERGWLSSESFKRDLPLCYPGQMHFPRGMPRGTVPPIHPLALPLPFVSAAESIVRWPVKSRALVPNNAPRIAGAQLNLRGGTRQCALDWRGKVFSRHIRRRYPSFPIRDARSHVRVYTEREAVAARIIVQTQQGRPPRGDDAAR